MMKKNFYNLSYLIFLPSLSIAKSEYFVQGVSLFNKKKFDDAKFKFEQDLVLNPKSELSYLYLSKIFNKQDKKKIWRSRT